MKRILWLIIGVFLLLLVSCVEERQVIKVTGITINPMSLTLIEGETGNLIATISPKNADNQSVIWASMDGNIASVSNGMVTANKAGTTTITAKSDDGGFTASCSITVTSKTIAVESVSLSKTELSLIEGESETIEVVIQPVDATDKTVSWYSSDFSVATVENGKITAINKGTASISATVGGKTANCKVLVEKKVVAVESIELNQTEIELLKGDFVTLVATVKPDDATDKTVSWLSSDSSIATAEEGKITAIKKGTATITAKSGEKSATCHVIVKSPVFGVASWGSTIDYVKAKETGSIISSKTTQLCYHRSSRYWYYNFSRDGGFIWGSTDYSYQFDLGYPELVTTPIRVYQNEISNYIKTYGQPISKNEDIFAYDPDDLTDLEGHAYWFAKRIMNFTNVYVQYVFRTEDVVVTSTLSYYKRSDKYRPWGFSIITTFYPVD